jgi:putative colanic acid biosynthesis acetyltransferase WcaF
MRNTSNFKAYTTADYKPGGNPIKRVMWYFTNVLFFICPLNPLSFLKVFLLKLYGAKIGKGVVIKPGVNIKYPWRLQIGDYSWIGEKVWIDNLADVEIGSNCCISQGALLLCGNHNYKKAEFDLMVNEIILEDGVWIGANSTVAGGVRCKSHAVLSLNSVASHDLDEYSIYRGNPAQKIKERIIE